LDYIQEGLEHLSDTRIYKKLDKDYSLAIAKHIKDILNQYRKGGILSEWMTKLHRPPNSPTAGRLYFLTKTHKNSMSIRPIVSTTNSATANLAQFLDHYLQPIMKQLPAYIKDTTQFINEVTTQFINEVTTIDIQPTDLLVTINVKKSIHKHTLINACFKARQLAEFTDLQHPPAAALRHLLELVLKLNTLEFNNTHYLQTSMGSSLAPAYANAFLGLLEQNIINTATHKPIFYHRFIVDGFLLFKDGINNLNKFINHVQYGSFYNIHV